MYMLFQRCRRHGDVVLVRGSWVHDRRMQSDIMSNLAKPHGKWRSLSEANLPGIIDSLLLESITSPTYSVQHRRISESIQTPSPKHVPTRSPFPYRFLPSMISTQYPSLSPPYTSSSTALAQTYAPQSSSDTHSSSPYSPPSRHSHTGYAQPHPPHPPTPAPTCE